MVASVLLGAAVRRHFSASNAGAARRAYLANARVRLREGFRRKGPGSCSSFSEGHGSSVKLSSSIDRSQMCAWHTVAPGRTASGVDEVHDGFNSGRSVDSGALSVVLPGSSRHFTVQEPDAWNLCNGKQLVDKGVLESSKRTFQASAIGWDGHNFDTSGCGTPVEPNILDVNPTSTVESGLLAINRHRMKHGEQELTTLLQDKGLDPNFAMMYEETGIHPPLLALLKRASLDADRDHQDNTEETALELSRLENEQSQAVSPSDCQENIQRESELCRFRKLCTFVAGTPERAWGLFSIVFIGELVAVSIFCPKTVTILNTTHKQVSTALLAYSSRIIMFVGVTISSSYF